MFSLKVKDLKIKTGYRLVFFFNDSDAQKYHIKVGDRLTLKKGVKKLTGIADIVGDDKLVEKGIVGLDFETLEKIKIENDEKVLLEKTKKPESLLYIKKKLKNQELTKKEIFSIIQDIVDDKLSDIEITYFVTSCYLHELTENETVYLTQAIYQTGNVLGLKSKKIIDKHCIGGVAGNRTTMIVVPIISALGYKFPKTSSRAITSPSGTADTMEVLTGVCFEKKKLNELMKKNNSFMVWGGALDFAPADDKIINVEHPLQLDPVGQLIASVLAKKKSVGATHLLIDIPFGKGAKIDKLDDAKKLKEKFEKIATKLNINIKVAITNGSSPIGDGFGPALEAVDVLKVLRNDVDAPLDLREKSIEMASELLSLIENTSVKVSKDIVEQVLVTGKAYEKMKDIIKEQGGNIFNPEQVELGEYHFDVKSKKTAIIKGISSKKLSFICSILGCPKDKKAGIFSPVSLNQKVKKEDVLYTLYAETKESLNEAVSFLKKNPKEDFISFK